MKLSAFCLGVLVSASPVLSQAMPPEPEWGAAPTTAPAAGSGTSTPAMKPPAGMPAEEGEWGKAPTKPGKPAQGAVQPREQGEGTWGAPANLLKRNEAGTGPQIPYDGFDGVRFGSVGCPLALVRGEFWNLQTFQPSGVALPVMPRWMRPGVISTDGKYFAASVDDKTLGDDSLTVYSTETGKVVWQKGMTRQTRLNRVYAAGPHLVAAIFDRDKALLRVFNIADGKELRDLPMQQSITKGTVAISPNGKLLAVAYHSPGVIRVHDLPGGNVVANLSIPDTKAMYDPESNKPATRVYKGAQLVSSAFAMTFSPDGSEISMGVQMDGMHLYSWTARGQLTFSASYDFRGMVSGDDLQTLPDNAGWLYDQRFVIDRKSKLPVLRFATPQRDDTRRYVLSKDQILDFNTLHDPTAMDPITLPWADIRKSADAANGTAPAYIKPGGTVSLELVLDNARGNPEETRKRLTDILARRLAREKITIKDNSPVIVRMTFGEFDGPALKKSTFRLNYVGPAPDDKLYEQAWADMILSVVARDTGQTLWAVPFTLRSNNIRQGASEEELRTGMLNNAERRIGASGFPYFISKDKNVLNLPVDAWPRY